MPCNNENALSSFLRVKRLSKDAQLPQRSSTAAAGYDLFSAENCIIPARGRCCVKTDIAVAIPPGHYGRVAPRSGLAMKHGIDVGAGVIDEDYRGNLGVVLFNHSNEAFQISKGSRVAQLILEKISTFPVEEVDNLDDTIRGSNGFGSTGF